MAGSRSSFSRRRGRGYASAQSSSSRPQSTPSRSNRPNSNFARPATHSQSAPTRRRVTINPHPSKEPSATPRSASPAPPAPDRNGRSDNAEELLDHIIVAIDAKEMGNVGCAYYIAREQRLFCMEDVPKGGAESIERLKNDLQPTVLLVPPRVDALLDPEDAGRLRRQSSLIENDEFNPPLPYDVELRPPPEFSYEAALTKLANLDSVLSNAAVRFLVPGENVNYEENVNVDEVGLTNRQGRLLQISAWLDLDNKVSVSCAGAVISYLQRKRASEYLQDDLAAQLAYRISHVEMFTFKDTMFVNTDALSSLQIIQPESHPNAFNQGPGATGSKESLSVFGLFQYSARTPQGKARLRQMFLRPSLDPEVINSRLDFVSVFVRPDNHPVARKLSKSLSKIKNMRNVMTMLHKGVDGGSGRFSRFKSGVWSSLLEFCYHTIDIVEGLREVLGVEDLPVCARAAQVLDRFHLQRIGRMVHDVVDLEASTEQHRTVVKHGVNENLDTIKNAYDCIDDLLSQTALEIARTMPAEIDCSLNVIFFPQLGFHITVPFNEATGQAIWDGGDQAWERMFTTRNQVYFKDAKMHELDQTLGDLWASICDIEIEIAHDLAQRVLVDERLLIAASDLCGELDSLLALVHGGVEYKLTRPRIVEENILKIKSGRHILQEMTVPSYVPNDAYLVGGSGSGVSNRTGGPSTEEQSQGASMLMLTGPNYSGKSVYQKQVALIVYMAQVGSFVPADAATVGITNKILTRITTRETVSKNQSAFMIDLQQIGIALNSCTRKSLVIIDEFGKGTDTCDGAGLAAGTFLHLLNLGDECPKVLAATHFHEIFDFGLFEDNPRIAFAHMEVHVDRKCKRQAGDHSSEVTYLYQLKEGRSTVSYGAQCAAINGIPSQVVARAAELAEHMSKGADLVSICSGLSAHEWEDLADAEAVSRVFLDMDFGSDGKQEDVTDMLDRLLNVANSSYMSESGEVVNERGSAMTER